MKYKKTKILLIAGVLILGVCIGYDVNRKYLTLKDQCTNNQKMVDQLIEQNKRIIQGPYYNSIQREYMGYSDENLIKIYNSAIFNGFNENWKPKGGN